MSAEETKASIRLLMEEAYDRGALEALREIYAESVIAHRPPLPDIRGLEALQRYIVDIRSALACVQITIGGIMVDGHAHAAPWILEAIHKGRSPAIPVPSTYRRVTLSGCSVGRWVDGKIAEQWDYVDWLGLFHQLGVIPPLDFYREADDL